MPCFFAVQHRHHISRWSHLYAKLHGAYYCCCNMDACIVQASCGKCITNLYSSDVAAMLFFVPLILILDAFPCVCLCVYASKSALNFNIASINEMTLLLRKASTLLCSFFVASKQLSVHTVLIHF